MTGVRYYSARRLSPLLGTWQVVGLPEARAVSATGASWHIEVLTEAPVRQPPWGETGPEREPRFFSFGLWSPADGLVRFPVNIMLGDQSSHPALAPLLAALRDMPTLPFPAADLTELWLLHESDTRPLLLLRSTTAAEPPMPVHDLSWRPLAQDDPGFAPGDRASHAAFREIHRPEEALRALLRKATGISPSAQWFRRTPEGGGVGLGGARIPAGFLGRRLETTAFPELPWRTDWPPGPSPALLRAYRDWLAPMLLTLPGLERDTRGELERVAAGRPELLYRYRRLLPEVIDRRLIDATLVEAVIRRTA